MSHRNSSTRLTSIARAIRHQTVSSERSINPVLIVVAIAFSLILLVGIAITVSGATYTFNRYTEIAKGVIPFVLIMLFTVFVVYLFPDLALYIPFKL